MFDEAKAKEFYVDFLGFKVSWEHRFEENFPLYMEVARDGCTIHLTEHHGDCSPGGAMRIRTEGVQAFCDALVKKKYKYANPGTLKTEWQTTEMIIDDPFGNRLIFYEVLNEG